MEMSRSWSTEARMRVELTPSKKGGQGEGENLPLEDLSQRAQVRGGLPLLGPGEDNVVVLPGRARGPCSGRPRHGR